MPDLTEFILARIADREALARAVMADQCSTTGEQAISTGDDPWPSERLFAEHFTPARVLAECEAKRRIVERVTEERDYDPSHLGWPSILRLLALPYAEHPDYREGWRP